MFLIKICCPILLILLILRKNLRLVVVDVFPLASVSSVRTSTKATNFDKKPRYIVVEIIDGRLASR